MPVDIGNQAREIIATIERVQREPVKLDKPRVEAAIARHFAELGIESLPVRWVADAEQAYATVLTAAESAAWSAAESAARSAAESAARSAAWSAAESAAWSAAESAAWSAGREIAPPLKKWLAIWLPFVEATDAGLWLYFVMAKEVLAVARPAMQLVDNRLHCADGPAVAWPNGTRYYFWRGVQVPEELILRPAELRVSRIESEQNAEVRRVMIERYGQQRFLKDSGAELVHQDARGKLWRKEIADDEPLVMVEVRNSTPESDGSVKDYFLRVPPNIKTATAAVAWTFGVTPTQYRPRVET